MLRLRRGHTLASACALLTTFAVYAGAAGAQTIHVTATTDPDPNGTVGDCLTTDNACSLRDAISAAQADADPSNTITLDPGIYSNTHGVFPTITKDLMVQGPAAGEEPDIEGHGTAGLFVIGDGPMFVTFKNLKIEDAHNNGGYGGAISDTTSTNSINLFVDHVYISSSSAQFGGAIAFNPKSMFGSFFPVLHVTHSALVGNAALANGSGGAVYVGNATASVSDSSIVGNTAEASGTGGGIWAGPGNGSGADVHLANVTLADNRALGIAGDGGNIFGGTEATFTFQNTLIARGQSQSGAATQNCGFTPPVLVTSNDYNIEGGFDQCHLNGAHDKAAIDPGLAADLSGDTDSTFSLALLPGSPAINGGNPGGCDAPSQDGGEPLMTDQRDVASPQGAACDVGAFEFRLPVVTGTPTVAGTGKVGQQLTCTPPSATSPDGGPVTDGSTWLRDSAPIPAATGATYTLAIADGGHTVACRYSASNDAGAAAPVDSAPVAIPGPPALGGLPTLSGSLAVGRTLSCQPPTVSSPGDSATTTFTWQRDGADIGGAGATTYTLAPVDGGHAITCTVTATNAAGSVSATSAAVTVPVPRAVDPVVTLASKRVAVNARTGKGTIRAACAAPAGDTCTLTGVLYGPGTLPARAAMTFLKHRHKRAHRLGTVSGTVAASASGTLSVTLRRAARRTLATRRHLTLRLVATVTDHAGGSSKLLATLRVRRG